MSSFNLWGNTPTTDGAAPFDHNSSHPQSQNPQERGAPVSPTSYYLNQVAGASEAPEHAVYPAQIPPVQVSRASDTTPREPIGHYRPAPQSVAVPKHENSNHTMDYVDPSSPPPAWNTLSDPVRVGRPRVQLSGSHPGQQPGVTYNQFSSTQPPVGRQRRSPSQQHFDPLSQPPPQESDHMPVDAPSSGTRLRCLISGCEFPTYFNVAEQEQMEYCGHGHELEAIQTNVARPCAMCKGRPRRSGERVCGPICRDRERQAIQVQGSYYGVQVTRREPQIRPR